MIQRPVLLLSFCCVALRSSFGTAIKQFTTVIILMVTALLSSSCGSNNVAEKRYPSTDSSVFYPVHDYLKQQVNNAASADTIIYIVTDSNNKKDSLQIDSITFINIAQSFLEDDINDISIKKNYSESIFHDQTTASNTFTYQSADTSLRLQSLDILLDTVSNTVKRVFMTRNYAIGDSLINEKLSWKTDKSFSINRIIQLPADKTTTQQINVYWH